MATQIKTSIEVPWDFKLGREENDRVERETLEAAAAKARAKNTGDLVGETVKWQVADSYAVYMIVSEKPLKLQHINICDGWRVDPSLIRGLRLVDAQAMVEQERLWRKLLSQKKTGLS